MKTILVTGCAGFIGSNFCSLFSRHYEIIGLDNLGRGSHEGNLSREIKFYKGNICRDEDLSRIFENHPTIDTIINFAAETHVDHSIENDSPFWSTNLQGVKNLARMAIKRKLRFIQISTDEVYGESQNGVPFSEDAPLNPRNPYAASKAAADLLLLSYHNTYGLHCNITRGTNTIGPRQSLDKAVPKAIHCFLWGSPFPLYRSPARRMWLAVEDHCEAIHKVLEKGRPGQIYNVSPPLTHEKETGGLIREIRDLLGKGEIILVNDRPGYDLRYLISSQKIAEELQWSSHFTLPELIKKAVNWYQQNRDWMEGSARKMIP